MKVVGSHIRDAWNHWENANYLNYGQTPLMFTGSGDMFQQQMNPGGVFLGATYSRRFVSTYPYLLTYCAQGVAHNQRIGLSIQPRSLQVRVRLECVRGAGAVDDADPTAPDMTSAAPFFVRTRYRVLIIRDRESTNNNNPMMWTDIFQCGAPLNPGMQVSTTNFVNIINATRFQFVADRSVVLNMDTPSTTIPLTISLRGSNLRYTDAPMEAVRTGHLFMIVGCEVDTMLAATATYAPNVSYESRLTYTDS